MATLATTEICDTNTTLVGAEVCVCCHQFSRDTDIPSILMPHYDTQGVRDNVLVRQLLETKGEGRVLVIDGGGSMRCALVGGNLDSWLKHGMGRCCGEWMH
ncbi:hypothetical protein DVH24_022580 [Malus domestica]|uniref:Oxaloacetate decarboxylase n=1 Tax=Malus domestica TaxID=3750 RepID=A0A498KLT4_MALDO|nr:hypothetical protein DVH24_022580 [Malus domestica]